MPLRTSFGLAIFALPAMISVAFGQTDPLSGRLASPTDSLCFHRDYDVAHLRQHKGQLTQAAMLSFRSYAVRVMLRQKGRAAPVYLVATCEWNARSAGIDTSGKPIIPSFRKPQGFDCIVIVSPGSAQEGGYAVVDPAADAKSLMLHLQTPAQARPSLDKEARVFTLNLGREDRAFRLMRTDPAACRAMEQALEGL